MRSVAFCTLGCKVNQYETDAMEELFRAQGYEVVAFNEKADIYIVNTCTVTNMADRKSRQMLHRAKKKNPEGCIVAVGCYVQASADVLALDDAVDLIVGNNHKKDIVGLVEEYFGKQETEAQSEEKQITVDELVEYETLTVTNVSEHTRAYIKIQDGCNQFCSYCIIPYARGRIRSREAADICAEITGLAAAGYKEFVLTGIHIASYGKDLTEAKETDALICLVEDVAKIPGVERIRFGSLEPGIITEDFAARLAKIPQICAHFHLSLQSGCEATLKRMNRHYTPEEYAMRCDILRKYFDRPAFTTDVIVGFPGETDEEFAATERFLDQIHFAEMHIFKYSPRKGTRAAVMPDQVAESVKNERSAKLIALGRRMQEDYIHETADRMAEVLLEETAEIDGKIYFSGHSKEYIKCMVPADGLEANIVVSCRIIDQLREDFVFSEIIR